MGSNPDGVDLGGAAKGASTAVNVKNLAEAGLDYAKAGVELASGNTDQAGKDLTAGILKATPGGAVLEKVGDKVFAEVWKDNGLSGPPPTFAQCLQKGFEETGNNVGDYAYKHMPPEKLQAGWDALKHAVRHPVETAKELTHAAPAHDLSRGPSR